MLQGPHRGHRRGRKRRRIRPFLTGPKTWLQNILNIHIPPSVPKGLGDVKNIINYADSGVKDFKECTDGNDPIQIIIHACAKHMRHVQCPAYV